MKFRHIPVFVLVMALLFFFGCNKGQLVKDYWPDGKMKSEIPYDKDGKIDGKASWYYENGNPEAEVHYHHGVLYGKLIRWTLNGTILSEDQYVDGKLEGLCSEWNNSGVKIKENTYKAGKLNGMSREWHLNGQKKIEGEYLDGNMQGEWLYWDLSGNLVGRGEYDHGQGIKKVYNPLGKQIKEIPVENNEEIEAP